MELHPTENKIFSVGFILSFNSYNIAFCQSINLVGKDSKEYYVNNQGDTKASPQYINYICGVLVQRMKGIKMSWSIKTFVNFRLTQTRILISIEKCQNSML